VVIRGRLAFAVLNRFPYNNGHLLIVPTRHVGRIESITQAEWLDLFALTKEALVRLKRTFKPHGYNLGINLGRAAGAGVPGHLHLHVVPRWIGDTNFMPAIAETKVISQSLASARRLLRRSVKASASPRRR
jgi:ATP adenylyltransferase